MGEKRFGYFYTKRTRNHLILNFSKDSPKFYGRRKGRKLSATAKMALIYGENYLIKSKNQTHYFSELFNSNKNQKIILEIGFGNGENLVELAKNVVAAGLAAKCTIKLHTLLVFLNHFHYM